MLRWLYPTVCDICGKESERSLCPGCLAQLPRLPRPICLYCGAALEGTPESTEQCQACRGKPRPFRMARSALQRTEETMRLLYKLKYHHCAWLAAGLVPAMAELWQNTPGAEDFAEAALVPVPTTRRHLNQRGYNQAEELARPLGKLLQLPVCRALERVPTEYDSQTGLNARRRALNAYKAFRAAPAYATGKRNLPPAVILVDDIYTTGSTARACCRALRRLPGVARVAVLTLVRA